MTHQFTTKYPAILAQLSSIDPAAYACTRNFINGKVTYLSPYLSRDVLSLPQVASSVLARGFSKSTIEKLIQELAWREYFQRVWQAKGEQILTDLKSEQADCTHHEIPSAIIAAQTGIRAIDDAIQGLQKSGYMHNHARMYLASVTCNIAKSHWLHPSKWMYYYLLDADLASNALSWQWVAGTFSSKKYYTNQENINKYMQTQCTGTYLDATYEIIAQMSVPAELSKVDAAQLYTTLPAATDLLIDSTLPTFIYNMYNLDPTWMKDTEANRVLLLEPKIFEQQPVCSNTIAFLVELAENICGMQVAVCSFSELEKQCGAIHFKEHPLNKHYTGTAHSRHWLFPEVSGYYGSFFSYWKQCERVFRKW
jgi:deoxyribodipyrimidine photo-lyase